MTFVVESNYKKYKRMVGYKANAKSPYAMCLHLHHAFRDKKNNHYYSEYELVEAWKKGRIRIVCISAI